jgi:hypothetical protein
MRTALAVVAVVVFCFSIAVAQNPSAPPARVQVTVNTSEAEAALAILDKRVARQEITDADWQKLFATEPYTRLKKREASMHRDFAADDFKKFMVSDDLLKRTAALHRTLTAWKSADLVASGTRVLAYLPADARIVSKVYLVIKPRPNSFVFEPDTDPTIFFYLDEARSGAQFENTAAHELHHIGEASVEKKVEDMVDTLPENVRPAVRFMGSFGEGIAMLAAAGGPDVHPHAMGTAEDRARWDHDSANFNQDLKAVEKFFLDITDGKLTKDQQQERWMQFFGYQGPWYTVGYKMAVMVEKRYGRAALVECVTDPRKLLRRYNLAAAYYNSTHEDKLERWSQELLDRIGGRTPEEQPESPNVQKS